MDCSVNLDNRRGSAEVQMYYRQTEPGISAQHLLKFGKREPGRYSIRGKNPVRPLGREVTGEP